MPWISPKPDQMTEITADACLGLIPTAAYDNVILTDVLKYLIEKSDQGEWRALM